jgi:hypothetical protein
MTAEEQPQHSALLYFYMIDGTPPVTDFVHAMSYRDAAEHAIKQRGWHPNHRVLVGLAAGGATVQEFQVEYVVADG